MYSPFPGSYHRNQYQLLEQQLREHLMLHSQRALFLVPWNLGLFVALWVIIDVSIASGTNNLSAIVFYNY